MLNCLEIKPLSRICIPSLTDKEQIIDEFVVVNSTPNSGGSIFLVLKNGLEYRWATYCERGFVKEELKIPFQTLPVENFVIRLVGERMRLDQIKEDLITKISTLATVDEGIYDFITMWVKASRTDRLSILDDLIQSVRDYDVKPSTTP